MLEVVRILEVLASMWAVGWILRNDLRRGEILTGSRQLAASLYVGTVVLLRMFDVKFPLMSEMLGIAIGMLLFSIGEQYRRRGRNGDI